MKEYVITINEKPYHIVVKKLHTDTATVEVDGREYEVGVERKIKRTTEPLEVKPVRRVAPTAAPAAAVPVAQSNDAVVAPLPGLILSILAKEGEKVKAGQTVLKMEAMKMENEIKADRDGSISKIFVKEGEAVLEGAPLVRIGE
ncbi:MAG: biotin/lipoyl-containing protein [Calditrichia bacterium]